MALNYPTNIKNCISNAPGRADKHVKNDSAISRLNASTGAGISPC
jgi:hypothetical protein